jgi:hypothetical protein
MDKATVDLVTGLAHALAWPLTVLIVVLSLRSKLGELLLRVRSFELGDTRLDFQHELHAISKTSEVREATESPLGSEDWIQPLDQLRSLGKSAPRQTVLSAWNQLMDACIELAHEHGMSLAERELKTPKYLAQRLRDEGLIDAQTCDAFVSMRLLRNKVAHAESMPVSEKDALAFIDMVASLMKTLGQNRKKVREPLC